MINVLTPYQLLGGEEGVRRLCNAFYDNMEQLPEAEGIRRMHGADTTAVREKLFEYLSGWLGGPKLYLEKYGTVSMGLPHRPFAIGPKERDQWMLCLNKALDDIGASETAKGLIKAPIYAFADHVRNRETSD
ncbi:group II truncated hemoglobin [Azorhizophilus paspali]|uniref:Group II truncated hemoglobin n=1 Tax=Azorhizophilus paspali TaxID=69963 RepID=A0ABV6SLH4_AZOPA